MNAVPVRGTQSFVGVMAEVFKRPSLTGLEVLWRWVLWCVVLAWPARKLVAFALPLVPATQTSGLSAVAGGLAPALILGEIAGQGTGIAVAVILWILVSAVGRWMVLRRADGRMRFRLGPMVSLGVLRWLWWVATVGLWLLVLRLALHGLVNGPLARREDPQWVGFFAVEIGSTLAIFVAWLATSWVFSLANIYAAQNGWGALQSLLIACRRGPIRSKVAEINLVMGIVKIALIVLAMVFSASPLPFETVETQSFLITWTIGVLLLYFVASDYFHVVRLVAFLRMTEVFSALPKDSAAQSGEGAS